MAKYDGAGNLGWVSTFGNSGGTGAASNSVYLAHDYLYVTGNTTTGIGSISQLFVRKIDLFGAVIWEKRVSGINNVFGAAVATDAVGNVITVGRFIQSTVIDFDPGPGVYQLDPSKGRGFALKLAADGSFLWAKNLNALPTSVSVDIDNNIYTAGSFSGTADFGMGAPAFNLSTSGNAGYIQKLDTYGYLLWAGQFGSSGDGAVNKMVSDSARHVYVTGYYSGTQDFDPDPSGSALTLFSSTAGSRDAFVLKLKDAQPYITSTNGNWNDGSTWQGGVVPPVDAAVIIRNVVALTENTGCYSLIIQPSGYLKVLDGLILTVNH